MDFNEYQKKAHQTADYPDEPFIYSENQMHEINVPLYPFLGLAGEAGETVEKIKKVIRNQKGLLPEDKYNVSFIPHEKTDIDVNDIIKELGDNLWYISECCTRLGITLEWIAIVNIEKLQDRAKRGVIKDSGDNR
jgi:NTP pyrophosphatase (non-canonical NTP hydrolase)